MIFPKLKEIATTNVITLEPTATVLDAIDAMVKNNIHDVIIDDEAPMFFGIITMQNIIMLNAEGINLNSPLATIRHERAPAYHMDASVLEIVDAMDANHQHICVIDDKNELFGIISHHDIISNIDPKALLERQTLGSLVRCGIIHSVEHDTQIQEIMLQMKDLNRDSIIVTKDNENIGIVTVSDIAIAISRRHPMDASVSEIMTAPVQTLSENSTLKEALDFIRNKRFRRVIVASKSGKLIGVLTKHDLVLATYNRWVDIITKHSEEMLEINNILMQRNEHLEKIAFIDHLTGIYNRTLVEQWLNSEKQRIAKYNLKPFSIFMADIDHFKLVNDKYGHHIGDIVLKELADLVKSTLRTTDFFARWGGEEFLALMPITTIDEANKVAAKIREAVENHIFLEVGHVTISIGTAQYNGKDNLESILDRADKALYKAKNSGRNRVESCESEAF